MKASRSPRSGRKAVTIADVARLSGFSAATVTRALQQSPLVRPATRQSVERAVEQLGYRPHWFAQALASRTSRTIGLLIPSSGDSFWGQVVTGAERRATEAGFSVLLANAHDDPVLESRATDLFLGRRVDGMILAGTVGREVSWFAAGQPPVPVVKVNWETSFSPARLDVIAEPVDALLARVRRAHRRSAISSISVDDFGAARRLTEHLIASGHRRMAFAGVATSRTAILRLLGFRKALMEAGLEPAGFVAGPQTLETGREAALTLLSARVAPTAIVAYDDMVAIGVMRGVRADGRRVPDDISVVGFDDIEVAEFVDPPLTTVRQPKEAMGRLAVEVVLRGVAGSVPKETHLLQGELVRRGSVGTTAHR
ncbi:MAG: LacI family DNA-binding transcriptional regulator [Streptosporangiaceae bacterium]